MSQVKLFSSTGTRVARRSGKPKKQKVKKPLKTLAIWLLVILCLEALYFFCVYTNNSFVKKWRTIYINTAMDTMRHQWLATYFIPKDVIDEVRYEYGLFKAATVGKESNANWGKKDDTPAGTDTSAADDNVTHINPNITHESEQTEDNTPTTEELEKQAQENFYSVFWELDRTSMEAYLAEHPDTLANGWDQIYINEAGFDDEGTSIQSIFGEQVLAIDAKTQDNVTIGLEVSAQYHVSYDMGAGPADSGIYKSYYMLQEPVDQMRDFITDALRSSIPVYTLDEVFAKKDDIAKDVNATVSEQMAAYGFTLVSTLITKIALPTEVENSMNDINAAQRKRAAAQELAEADRIKRVTEATAEAEAMEKAGEGIANQRKAIALGIKDSLEIIQETGVGNDEANQLFMFTQWSEMMTEFARTGKTSTVVLPSDFSQSASMFEQMLTAGKVQNDSKE